MPAPCASAPARAGALRRACGRGAIGPDGVGKTRLARLVAGLVRPQRGGLEEFGLEVARDPDGACARIGYMAQNFFLSDEPSQASIRARSANCGGGSTRSPSRASRCW